MKKVKIYSIIVFICIIGIIITISLSNKCEHKGCNNSKIKGSNYCENHTCQWEGCNSESVPGMKYCYEHEEEYGKQITEEDKLELSDSQIEGIKQVIKEYSDNLIAKQDSILAVNLLSDTPVTAYTTGITFNCNVVRTDSDTNLATIYVVMNSDGSFKIQSLMYDNE